MLATLLEPREGVIIECPLNDLFHNVVTVILTSRMGVSEMVVNVGNVVTVIYGIIHRRQTVIFRKNHSKNVNITTIMFLCLVI